MNRRMGEHVMVVAGAPGRRCGVGDYARLLGAAMQADHGSVCHVPVPANPVSRTHLISLMRVRRRVIRQTALLGAPDVVHAHYSDFSWNGVRAYEDCYELFTRKIHGVGMPAPRLFVTLHEHPWFRDRHVWDRPRTVADRLFACLAGQIPVPPSLPLAIFKRHHGIHVHHEWQKAALVASGVPGGLVRVIPHPVPECEAAPEAVRTFRQRFGLEGKRMLAMTGFIFERKRYERVIGVLAALPEDVVLCALGGANGRIAEDYLRYLRHLAELNGVAHRFVVTGYLAAEEMNAGLKAANAFVAPYGEVSSSGSVARCIAAGAPIVAGECPTFTEMREQGAGMVSVNPDDRRALTLVLVDLLGDEGMGMAMRKMNAHYAQAWSFPAVARLMTEWYAGKPGAALGG